jgi:hypothetical protein
MQGKAGVARMAGGEAASEACTTFAGLFWTETRQDTEGQEWCYLLKLVVWVHGSTIDVKLRRLSWVALWVVL